jgi:hypothetical protein
MSIGKAKTSSKSDSKEFHPKLDLPNLQPGITNVINFDSIRKAPPKKGATALSKANLLLTERIQTAELQLLFFLGFSRALRLPR